MPCRFDDTDGGQRGREGGGERGKDEEERATEELE